VSDELTPSNTPSGTCFSSATTHWKIASGGLPPTCVRGNATALGWRVQRVTYLEQKNTPFSVAKLMVAVHSKGNRSCMCGLVWRVVTRHALSSHGHTATHSLTFGNRLNLPRRITHPQDKNIFFTQQVGWSLSAKCLDNNPNPCLPHTHCRACSTERGGRCCCALVKHCQHADRESAHDTARA
jgi:hypothetical protein